MYVGKEEICNSEVSMTVYMGRIANQRKVRNGYHLKALSQNY